MTMRYLISTYANYDHADTAVAYFELTPAQCQKYLDRQQAFVKQQKKDKDLYEWVYWDYTPLLLRPSAFPDKEQWDVTEIYVPESTEQVFTGNEEDAIRRETSRLVIDARDIWWVIREKHTCTEYTTHAFGLDQVIRCHACGRAQSEHERKTGKCLFGPGTYTFK
jgi:hypothetical protein